MNGLARVVLAKVVTIGQLNRSIGAILLVAASCPLVGCAETADTDSDQVANASQAMHYGAGRFGCPSSTRIALKSYNNYYCQASNTNEWMTCYGNVLNDWGRFRVIELDDGTNRIALQAQDDTFVSASNGGGGGIWHNRAAIGPWESFYTGLVPGASNVYYFKTNDKLHYVTAENGGGGVMNANRNNLGTWERFQVECVAECGG